ncbi:MAG: 4-(cytidine 5'-diphospho)-2-C-methyl-D-erythritol kinase [Clostridia bacterium]|nr:4-(cytidine 5'-diphospho)-2-C-methyl-D-erythritol kinase [Clostridia bacterium]
MKLSVNAPAKLNLYLDILDRLPNGYHSLAMVMQAVALYDTVTLEETAEPGLRLSCSDPALPCDEQNLAHKAATAFFKALGEAPHHALRVEKRIPMAAGLAGGSADAAAVLVGLNALYGRPYDLQALCEIGLTVGSDVPFCVRGGTCLAQHTGGILAPLPPLPACTFVLVKPERAVSTAEAYAAADSVYLYHPSFTRMLQACAEQDLDGICRLAGNVFEQVIDVPERIEIKQCLRRYGAKLCQMSGSGPTVFGLFEDEAAAAACAETLQKTYRQVFVAAPLPHGAVIDR